MEEMLIILAIREVTESRSRECLASLLLFDSKLVLGFDESWGPALDQWYLLLSPEHHFAGVHSATTPLWKLDHALRWRVVAG